MYRWHVGEGRPNTARPKPPQQNKNKGTLHNIHKDTSGTCLNAPTGILVLSLGEVRISCRVPMQAVISLFAAASGA